MMIRFGMACDRCPASYNDYSVGDIRSCNYCGDDLCATCAHATGHRRITEDDETYAKLSCEDEEAA